MQKDEIVLKTSVDIARIRRSSRIIENTFSYLKQFMQPGIKTSRLEKIAKIFIDKRGGRAALRGFKNFPGRICTSVNNVIAHGMPGDYELEDGDIVTVDIIVEVDGWYADGSWTYGIGNLNQDSLRLIRTAWQATLAGIKNAKAGSRMGDIGFAIKEVVDKYGCSVARDCAGHGIGKGIHEDPAVPNIGEKGIGIPIVPGMVFTIEPLVYLGSGGIKLIEDGFTLITVDGSMSAQYEHTVAIWKDYTEVLTFSNGNIQDYLDFPPFF